MSEPGRQASGPFGWSAIVASAAIPVENPWLGR
jgi:hypothetical protein